MASYRQCCHFTASWQEIL